MEKKKIRDLSSMTPRECIMEHAYWIFAFFIVYKSIVFVPLDGFSVEKSKVIMIMCMLITSIVGTVIRWRKFMTTRGVIADVMSGLGVYTILAYKKYYSDWINGICIAFLVFFIIFSVSVFARKSRGQFLTEIRNKNRKSFIVKSRLFKTLSVSGLVLGFLMTVLMVPMSYNRFFHGGIVVADVKYNYKGFDSNYTENNLSLADNIESISKIRFKSQWAPLTISEKLNVLQDICNCESNYWGMDFKVSVVMDDLDEYTRGSYCDSERSIAIDKQHLENNEPEEILNTILHEMYHAWEHSLVRLYLDSSDSQRKMRVFMHCEEYIKEIMNYQESEGDYESYMSYYCQYMEQDSRSYAAETVKVYYAEIDRYLEEKNSKNTE